MKEDIESVKSMSVIAPVKEIDGFQLWPVSYGIIKWLTDVRKNPITTTAKGGGEPSISELDIAEVCFAFMNNPLDLRSLSKAKADKMIEDLLYGNSSKTLGEIVKYCSAQLKSHLASMTTPKKKPATLPRVKQKKKTPSRVGNR